MTHAVAAASTRPFKHRRRTILRSNYESLEEYLCAFGYTVPALQTAPALERVAYEFGFDCFSANVRYVAVSVGDESRRRRGYDVDHPGDR